MREHEWMMSRRGAIARRSPTFLRSPLDVVYVCDEVQIGLHLLQSWVQQNQPTIPLLQMDNLVYPTSNFQTNLCSLEDVSPWKSVNTMSL